MKDMSSDVFPVAVEDLALGSRVAELGLEGMTLLYCKLELDVKDLRSDVGMMSSKADSDWFAWKLKRATEYRMRGNAAFKQESYRFALQLYKRSLAWLEPPSTQSDATLDMDVQYSTEELQQVNPVAVACYANMATCYSKLDNSVKNCIDAASNALAFDDTHLKARYRRSQAYMSSKEYDLALADLNKLCELEPANKLFQSAYTQAKTAKLQLRQKQQNAYANLFHK
ncbi:hypothetical protein PsorP6_005919 [Peronosclerospora sorghi]|uniref:Uncharacterized protein n=1 Tax=Peronosclerospora sorghi TaxID=230839 RepID=A0ACC0W1L1_9STRA|nr:hypothetical protein PsorP6_005919 [Peronosclerospora sorghi]